MEQPTNNNVKAIITGASKGLGKAIAVKFAQNGIDCAIVGRDKSGLEKTRDKVTSYGQDCLIIEADLQNKEEVEKIANKALEHNPYWDILVNNAGVAKKIPLLEVDDENW